MAYDEKTRKEICKYLSEGETIKDSCALVGISTETYYDWKKNKPDFSDAVDASEAKAARERTQRVRAAGVKAKKKWITDEKGERVQVLTTEGDWKADAWWLERRRRDEYASKSIHDVKHSVGEGVTNALQLVGAILEGTKTGRRKTKRSTRSVPKKS